MRSEKDRQIYNQYMKSYIAARYLMLKLKAIEYKGGKCVDCGYNKSYAALEFHHRNPDEKNMDWGRLRKRSWATIKKELDKCDMICANCHRERHHDEDSMNRSLDLLKSVKRIKKQIEDRLCLYCEEKFSPKYRKIRYCSRKCARASKEAIEWPTDLPKLVKSSSMSAVARLLKVSDKTVKKRLIRHHNVKF